MIEDVLRVSKLKLKVENRKDVGDNVSLLEDMKDPHEVNFINAMEFKSNEVPINDVGDTATNFMTDNHFSFGSNYCKRFTGQGITDEPNFMYEDGDWMTDASNGKPPKLMANSVIDYDSSINVGDLIPDIQETEFIPSSECLEMLDAEEKRFEQEEEDKLKAILPEKSLLQDEWSINNDKDFYKKMSIGTFLSMGSEDMGCLEGKLAASRPVIFSHNVQSPPSNRKPPTLLKLTSTRIGNSGDDSIALSASDLVSSGQLRTSNHLNISTSFYSPPVSSLKQLMKNNQLRSEKLDFSQQSALSSIETCGSIKGQFLQSSDLAFEKCGEIKTINSDNNLGLKYSEDESKDGNIPNESNVSMLESSILDVSKFVEKMAENYITRQKEYNLSEFIVKCSNAKWKESRDNDKINNDSLVPTCNQSKQSASSHDDGRSSKLEHKQHLDESTNKNDQIFKIPDVPKMPNSNKKVIHNTNSKLKILENVSNVDQSSQEVLYDRDSIFCGRISSQSIKDESRIPSMYFKACESGSTEVSFIEGSKANMSMCFPEQSQPSHPKICTSSQKTRKESEEEELPFGIGGKNAFRKLDMSKHSLEQSKRMSTVASCQSSTSENTLCDIPSVCAASSCTPFAGARPKISSEYPRELKYESSNPSQPTNIPFNDCSDSSRKYSTSTQNSMGRAMPFIPNSRPHSSVSSSTDVMVPLRSLNETLDTGMEDAVFQNFGHQLHLRQEIKVTSSLPSRDSSPRCSSRGSMPILGNKDLKLKPIKVEHEYNIPQVCCIGLTTKGKVLVTNLNPVSVLVKSSLTGITCDGGMADSTSFHRKEKFHLRPSESKEFKIIFSPTIEGTYKCGLGFTIISPGTGNVHSSCSLTAISEMPQIEITCQGSPSAVTQLDFESVPWNSFKTITISIKNKGRSLVPLDLLLSTMSSKQNFFYFANFYGDQTDADVTVSENVVIKLFPNQNLCLSPNSQLRDSNDTQVDFDSSHEKKLTLLFRSPEEEHPLSTIMSLAGRLKVELYKSSMLIPLGSIPLLAEVGSIKLKINKQVLHLRNINGEHNPVEILTLVNTGSIIANIHLEMKSQPSLFSVNPSHVMVEPEGRVDLTVAFNANRLQKGAKLEDRLVLRVRPSCQTFEVMLKGEVIEDPQSARMMIMSSHWTVFWSALQARISDGIQTVTLCNRGDKLLKMLLEIKGNMQFKLVASSERRIETVKNRIIVIKPGSDFKVGLQFNAAESGFYTAKLIISDMNGPSKFRIPMFGYEGESSLTIHGADLNPMGHFITTAEKVDDSFFAEVLLTNDGRRTCYVKAVIYKDEDGSQPITVASASVSPNMFCLRENESQKVIITLPESHANTSLVGMVRFHFGDEINRQLHMRLLRGSFNSKGVDFSGEFANEEFLMAEEIRESDGIMNTDQFQSSIKKLTLILIDQNNTILEAASNINDDIPQAFQRPSTPRLFTPVQQSDYVRPIHPSSILQCLQNVHLSDRDGQQLMQLLKQNFPPQHHGNFSPINMNLIGLDSPPIRDNQSLPQNLFKTTSSKFNKPSHTPHVKRSWAVNPSSIELDVDDFDDKRKFVISNQSSERMSFKIEKPFSFLNFSSLFGDIEAGSEIKIFVSIHPLEINLKEPYHGIIQVVKTAGVPDNASNVKAIAITIASGSNCVEDQSHF